MSKPVLLRNAVDCYTSQKYPNRNFRNKLRMYLADDSSANTRYGWIYFGIPSGMTGTTLMYAKLRLYVGGGDWSGSVTMDLDRAAEKWSTSHITWNNRPGNTGGITPVTHSNSQRGQVYEFDVTGHLQQVANGSPWYGFRIQVSGPETKYIISSEGPSELRPELELQWSDAPDTPEKLRPDFGQAVSVAKPTLVWDFVDPAGDVTMSSANLRMFSSEALADANGTGDVLDVNLTTDVPEYDLDDSTYGGLSEGSTVWWRVQNIDGAGIMSGWSDPAYFTRTAKGVLDITNPAAAIDPDPAFVTEGTPPFSWTFTGQTQEAYEVILTTPESPGVRLWSSGRVTSTDTAATPPSGKITDLGKTYRVLVRVWDDVDRPSLPDDKRWVETYRDFVFDRDAATNAVTGLTLVLDYWRSKATIEWNDATAPDDYVLFRDGSQVEEFDAVDAWVSGTHYQYVDYGSAPRRDHTWEVARKVNGKLSKTNPTVGGFTRTITTTLSEKDDDRTIYLFNPEVDAEKVEDSEVHRVLGDAPPVLISQSIRGYEGQISGVLLNNTVPGLSAETQLNRLAWFKDHPGVQLKLVWVDKVMTVVVWNVTDEPIPHPDGTVEYLASFEFFQVDF